MTQGTITLTNSLFGEKSFDSNMIEVNTASTVGSILLQNQLFDQATFKSNIVSILVDDELPNGYRRLLDVITSGDLRYVSNIHLTGADTLKFTYKSSPGNLLGSYHDTDADDNYSYYPTSNTTAKYARYNGQTGGSSSATGTVYTIEMSPTGIEGSRNPSSFTPSTFTASVPFCIFATSPTGTSISNGTIYGSIEISGGQTVKFIPCKRMSDGVIGYYETLNGEFLEAIGTGVPSTSGYDDSHLS